MVQLLKITRVAQNLSTKLAKVVKEVDDGLDFFINFLITFKPRFCLFKDKRD